MTKITSQAVSQGSYGLYKINAHGMQIGRVIRVWHVVVDGRCVGTYLTRQEARSMLWSNRGER